MTRTSICFKNLQENVKHRVELYMEQAAASEQAA